MAATTLLTTDRFLALPDGGPQPPQRHDIVRSNILEVVFGYVSACPGLRLKVLPSTAFVLGSGRVVVPDASIIPIDAELDLRRNVHAYLSSGSKSVWIVYPETRDLQICTQDSIRQVKADQSITDPLLPGFSSPVASFFELT